MPIKKEAVWPPCELLLRAVVLQRQQQPISPHGSSLFWLMLFVERIGKPRVVIGVRTLFQCRTEGEARLLPFAVLHQRLAQRAPQQRAVTDGFDLLTQHFLDLLWVIGFQARDHHDQTIAVLALETVEEDLWAVS